MNKKATIATLLIVSMSVLYPYRVLAQEQQVTLPSFPNCKNPQGSIKVTYSEGTHGIPGNSSIFVGSDSVYTLTTDTTLQCFCPVQGDNGIQTNWWKVSELSIDQIESLVALGWVYIPNGAEWGLDEEPYLAFNISYDCKDEDKKKDKKHHHDDNDEDDDKRIGGILGATGTGGQILGLAATGSTTTVLLPLISGTIALGISYAILKKNN